MERLHYIFLLIQRSQCKHLKIAKMRSVDLLAHHPSEWSVLRRL